jgi:hypothetical protein
MVNHSNATTKNAVSRPHAANQICQNPLLGRHSPEHDIPHPAICPNQSAGIVQNKKEKNPIARSVVNRQVFYILDIHTP